MTRFPNGVSSYVYTLGSVAALPQTATVTKATITGGRILLLSITALVTTIIQAQANAAYWSAKVGALTAVNLCGTAGDLNGLVVGCNIYITGTLATNLQVAALYGVQIFQATPITIGQPGVTTVISLTTAASSTGALQHTFLWTPIDPAAKLVAA